MITGESGCGKTSLLSIISLNEPQAKFDYYLDGEKLDLNHVDLIKLNLFSYVFQDYDLMKNHTILDSIKMAAEMSENIYNEEGYLHLLQMVKLNHLDVHTKVSKLSGGEKQRLALALAILKDTPFLLLDEPTASLDQENSECIVGILDELKKQGKGIIIVSHNPDIYHYDRLLTIKDKTIINDNIQSSSYTKTNFIKQPYITKITKYFIKNRQFNRMIYSLLIGICLGLSSVFFLYGNGVTDFYSTILKQMNDRELIVYSSYNNTNNLLNPSNPVNEADIQQIDNIENYYPYYTFGDVGSSYLYIDGSYKLTDLTEDSITYMINDQELLQTDLGVGWNGVAICAIDEQYDLSYNDSHFTQVSKDLENGIYITESVADQLNIDNIEGITVSFRAAVPVISSKSNNNTQEGMTIGCIVEEFTFPIKGIKKQDSPNNLTNNAYPDCFYMDYHLMDQIMKQCIEEHSDFIQYYRMNRNDLNITEMGYQVKSYILQVEDVSKINQTIQDIVECDPNYYVYGARLYYKNFIDVQKNIQSTHIRIAFLIGAVILLFNIIIQKINLHSQRKDYLYLSINGLSYKSILVNVLYRQLIFSLPIVVIIIGIAMTITKYLSGLNYIQITYNYLIYIIGLYVLLMISSYLTGRWELKSMDYRELTVSE